MAVGSFNNLKDVHQLHCLGYEPIKKDDRNIFVKGSPKDVLDNFQVYIFITILTSACFMTIKNLLVFNDLLC
jgi:hypothetical protein